MTASLTPVRDFRSASAAGSVSSRKARHSRTSTGAVLWFNPATKNFMRNALSLFGPQTSHLRYNSDRFLIQRESGADLRRNVGVGYCPDLRGHRLFELAQGALHVLVRSVILPDSAGAKNLEFIG